MFDIHHQLMYIEGKSCHFDLINSSAYEAIFRWDTDESPPIDMFYIAQARNSERQLRSLCTYPHIATQSTSLSDVESLGFGEPTDWTRFFNYSNIKLRECIDAHLQSLDDVTEFDATHPKWRGILALSKGGDFICIKGTRVSGTYRWHGDQLIVRWYDYPQEIFVLENEKLIYESARETVPSATASQDKPSAEPASPPQRELSPLTAPDPYEFTVDWFSRSAGAWTPLLSQIKPKRILEIGSFEGRSATFVIENCSSTHEIEIVCVDTWEGSVEHDKSAMSQVEQRFDHNVSIARLRAQHEIIVRKLKNTSGRALVELIAQEEPAFDLIYVDGSHQAPDVLLDAILSFQLLRVGGLLIFDDYLWRMQPDGEQDPFTMPKPAIDAFVNIFQRKLRVLDGFPIWQLYVIKTKA